jgi:hypothetical protein
MPHTSPSIVTRRTMRRWVIVDCLVLCCAIVRDHHIAHRPAPARRVFQPRYVVLQHGKQMRRIIGLTPRSLRAK